MPNNQELRLQQTQMLSHQDFRSARAIPSPKQEHHNYTSARSLPSRAQNLGFCALLGSETPVFWLLEHKIGIFVRFWGLEPSFSGLSSTKSRFLCAFRVWKPYFRASQAQNLHFCARSEGQVASGSVKVTFLQFTAHTSKTQIPHNQIINF